MFNVKFKLGPYSLLAVFNCTKFSKNCGSVSKHKALIVAILCISEGMFSFIIENMLSCH